MHNARTFCDFNPLEAPTHEDEHLHERVDTHPDVVLVLGMHRSGTSALTGALGLCGGALPGDLIPAREENAKGFFESTRIVEFHDKLLGAFGSRWDDPLPVRPVLFDTAEAAGASLELANLLSREFNAHAPLVIKDPRMCKLLPIWVEALDLLGWRSVAVLPLRHPLEVAASLQRRNALDEHHGLAMWMHHTLLAERATRGMPRVFVLYDELLRDGSGTIEKIREELGMRGWLASTAADDQISQFLSTDLRHHTFAPYETAEKDLSPPCGKVWKAIRVLIANPRSEAARLVLDGVWRELEIAIEVLGPLVATLDENFYPTKAALERSQSELEAVLSSTFWRATQPLRSGLHWLRGRAGL
jgi:hypothetical protein